MNRDFKLRVWDGKEMHYPRVIYKSEDYEKKLFFSYDAGDVWCVTHDSLNESSVTLWLDSVAMQFTNTTDAANKDVYDGDVFFEDEIAFVIKWNSYHASWDATNQETLETEALDNWIVDGSTQCRFFVAGNIHEHNYLLLP